MLTDSIARTRRFHRAVTTEAGVLDASFLGRRRPLGPARVLNAIGRGITDIAEIRSYLRLDSGLASRLLRGLEEEGLVQTGPSPEDGRRRIATLTPAGDAEYAAYEALSDVQAAEIIARHPRPEVLLEAMDIVATALSYPRSTLEEVDPGDPRAIACLEAYYAELARRLRQGFDVTLSADPEAGAMRPPRGSFLLALSDGMPIGCVGLKGTEKGYAEIKRMWVAPSARGMGLAGRMMAEVEARARELGITLLRLDSNSALPEAVGLYRKLGWQEIPRFNEDPYPDVFFEKAL
ncbi:bifunctional helix-turn-helix transcriptional regulator/GNAT family N-acetyltransferase [Pseudooceanicola sp. CBS1P-1]|uniref:GNAT family N-acetyltransferase n=1 Tax=Pseudooceanicola albus TaxID=2692189 RepID=A0A6L7G6N2_9RHOB|nr:MULTISPECIES: helix-turn-helix domain-containing GNAT family N-acetyltransferase [Pseudooceanicola]MBT9385990.1 bifunctional helix-turn-helix transcriptional regulator/GNAT family N-acetyltransferase [Pseudooceanicola endophyticus]MXN19589.1 GNAT family N-acetyltransferase [Pseudooceanicola albus]